MRVTIGPDGRVEVDVDGVHEAAALVSELLRGKPKRKRGRPAKSKPAAIESTDEPLSAALVDTWNWLVAHDCPEGSHASEVADGLGLKEPTALYRLNKLKDKELAHRVNPGYYRAGG